MTEPRATIQDAAKILGCGWHKANKLLRKMQFAYPQAADGTYDARVLDIVRAMRGEPHRALEPAHQDWLARYMEEAHAPKGT